MGSEIIFIFLLALILFGPKQLPRIAREIGKYVAQFKRASADFQRQLQVEIDKLEDTTSPRDTGRAVAQKGGGTPPSISSPSIQPPELPSAAPQRPEAERQRLLDNARLAYDSKSAPVRGPQVPDTGAMLPPAPIPPRSRAATESGTQESGSSGPDSKQAAEVSSPTPEKG